MKKFIYILIVLISFTTGTLTANTSFADNLINKLVAYTNYYNATEKVLDLVNKEDDSFMDTIGSTDEYQEYLETRDSLNNVKL